MRIRLEGALVEWNRLLALPISGVTLWRASQSSLEHVTAWTTRGDALNDPDFAYRVAETAVSIARNGAKENWLKTFHPAVEIATELASYCEEYERTAANPGVADFYRRRVERAASVLYEMDILNAAVKDALEAPAANLAPTD